MSGSAWDRIAREKRYPDNHQHHIMVFWYPAMRHPITYVQNVGRDGVEEDGTIRKTYVLRSFSRHEARLEAIRLFREEFPHTYRKKVKS